MKKFYCAAVVGLFLSLIMFYLLFMYPLQSYQPTSSETIPWISYISLPHKAEWNENLILASFAHGYTFTEGHGSEFIDEAGIAGYFSWIPHEVLTWSFNYYSKYWKLNCGYRSDLPLGECTINTLEGSRTIRFKDYIPPVQPGSSA